MKTEAEVWEPIPWCDADAITVTGDNMPRLAVHTKIWMSLLTLGRPFLCVEEQDGRMVPAFEGDVIIRFWDRGRPELYRLQVISAEAWRLIFEPMMNPAPERGAGR